MVERAVYPDKVGVLVAGLDLTRDSITERLEELGIVFADAEHVIDAVAASAEEARWLQVRAGAPLLRERRFTTDRAGQPVEWSDDRYLGTRDGVQRAQLRHGQRAVPHPAPRQLEPLPSLTDRGSA